MSDSAKSADIDTIAADWAVREDRGGLSADESRERDAWLDADPRHMGAYARAQAIWGDMDRMGALASGRKPAAAPPRAGWRVAVMSMAALICVCVIGAGLLAVNQLSGRETARIGEVRQIAMNDGSLVMLNTDSTIQTKFDEETRRVLLRQGEASFHVAKENRPFIVQAGDVSVTAVGTRFSVRRDGVGGVAVVVAEGVVDVARTHSDGSVQHETLRADRSLRIAENMPLQPVRLSLSETQRRLSWEEGKLVFDGESLRDAAREMNRYSSKKIVIEDAALADAEFVGVFRIGDSRAFANAIATAFDAKVDEDESVLRITTRS